MNRLFSSSIANALWSSVFLLLLGLAAPSDSDAEGDDSEDGSRNGGVLVVHHDPAIAFSTGCANLIVPASVEQLLPSAPADGTPQLFFILGAFPEDHPVPWSALCFGLQYDAEEVEILEWGACPPSRHVEIPDPAWPAPGTGTALSWGDELTAPLAPIYWFVAEASTPTGVTVVGHPAQGAYFGGRASSGPAEGYPRAWSAPVFAAGTMGFGLPGSNPVPVQPAQARGIGLGVDHRVGDKESDSARLRKYLSRLPRPPIYDDESAPSRAVDRERFGASREQRAEARKAWLREHGRPMRFELAETPVGEEGTGLGDSFHGATERLYVRLFLPESNNPRRDFLDLVIPSHTLMTTGGRVEVSGPTITATGWANDSWPSTGVAHREENGGAKRSMQCGYYTVQLDVSREYDVRLVTGPAEGEHGLRIEGETESDATIPPSGRSLPGGVIVVEENPVTDGVLRLRLPDSANESCVIDLIDVSGRLVAQIFDGAVPQREYSIERTLESAPSGVYFLRMQSGEETSVQTITLVR